MAIEIFEGRPGGGKSYNAVLRIVSALIGGRRVFTNLSVKPAEIFEFVLKRYRLRLDPSSLVVMDEAAVSVFQQKTTSGSLIVLDEVHLHWNARDWAMTSRELLNYLTLNRHFDNDLIFISQSAENIDKQFRRLVEFIWRFRDMRRWTATKLGIGRQGGKIPDWWMALTKWIPFGGSCLVICHDYDGRTVVDRQWLSWDPAVFGLYDSKAMHGLNIPRMDLPPVKAPERDVSRIKNMRVWQMAIVVVLGLVGAAIWKLAHREGPPSGMVAAVTGGAAKLNSTNLVEKAGVKFAGQHHSPTSSIPQVAAAPKPLTGVDRFERLRAFMGDLLITDRGQYNLGDETPEGKIVQVTERGARILMASGRSFFVRAVEGVGAVALGGP